MNPHNASLPSWLFRLMTRRPSAPSSSLTHSRVEVCPPELWPSSLSWRGRLNRLGNRLVVRVAPWLPEPARPVNRLARVKQEFQDSLADLDRPAASPLREQIDRARSLRELWHLRSPVYGAVAVAHTQADAERRLARLNRHFPLRAARTGLATFQA